MTEYSILDEAFQLGARVVDLDTGELLPFRTDDRGLRVSGGSLSSSDGVGGLSNPHICTSHQGGVTYYLGGSLITCNKPRPKMDQEGGGRRGTVKTFTAGARRRMQYMIGRITRSELPLMITLTYPSEWSEDSRKWKNDLRKFFQRLERKITSVGCIWKLEPQKRGAPHFHLLVWGLGRVPMAELWVWVALNWFQVVGSGDQRHLVAGTRVERIKNWKGVMSYAAKYLGKLFDGAGWDQPGRFWGVKGSKNIPWAAMVRVSANNPEAARFLRLMRRYMKCRRGNLPSLSMLCNNPEYWFDRHDRLIT